MDDYRASEPAICDYGSAPTITVGRLARVDILGGITRFAFCDMKVTVIEGSERRFWEVTNNLLIATEFVAPIVELTLATFGPRLLLPAAGCTVKRLLM